METVYLYGDREIEERYLDYEVYQVFEEFSHSYWCAEVKEVGYMKEPQGGLIEHLPRLHVIFKFSYKPSQNDIKAMLARHLDHDFKDEVA